MLNFVDLNLSEPENTLLDQKLPDNYYNPYYNCIFIAFHLGNMKHF